MKERLTSVRLIARKIGASMKTAKTILVVGVLLFAAAELIASGPVGIYAIIENVIFEPSEEAPERIQIWGAFAVVDGGLTRPGATSKPLRGYLYFKLPDGSAQEQDRKSTRLNSSHQIISYAVFC